MQPIDDLRIKRIRALISPMKLMDELAPTAAIANLVSTTRECATAIIQGQDNRLLVIAGPCSIHDTDAALAYAEKLKKEADLYADELLIVMRTYFEKPRTTIGWKGLINDPRLNNSFEINHGLRLARQLLLDINHLGLAAGTEFLDTIIPQYIADLIAWGAIGARTTESQIHRELASGLSMPIGFKNGTSGDIQIALDAIRAAHHSHHFLSVTKQGLVAIVSTQGNDACHIILRGSNKGTNYDSASINQVTALLKAAELPQRIMIDCSHGNSNKDHTRQAIVAAEIAAQIGAGSKEICGVMLESNLIGGKQTLQQDKDLVYGQSITDACLSLEETKPILKQLAQAVNQRKQQQRLAMTSSSKPELSKN